MHNDEVNEFQIIRRSSYYDYDKFNDFAKENKDRFNILSTNIQSINSKFSELELFLEYLDSINFKFNVICMQETWKAEGDDFSQFMLQCYNCTVVPALGDPRRERPPAVCGHIVNVPTHFKVKLPVIIGHLPNADADSHLLVVSTCYNGQCKQMPRFRWSFQPKIVGAHPNLRPTDL